MNTLGKWLLRSIIALLIIVALLIAGIYAIRTWLLPDLTVLQPQIEAKLSETLKQPVRVQGLAAAWNWVSVDLKLAQLSIGPIDAPAIEARNIQTTLNAYPLLWKTVSTQSLAIEHASVLAQQIGSKASPKWLLASIDVAAPSDGSAMRWVLDQPSLKIGTLDVHAQDAAAHWLPESKTTVKLAQLGLTNSGREHALSFDFAPDYQDLRLGNSLRFETAFNHALTGDASHAKSWSGSAKIDVPNAQLGNSATWLIALLSEGPASTAKSNPWLRWLKQSMPKAATASISSTVTFKQGAVSATGRTALAGLSAQKNDLSTPLDWSWQPNVELNNHTIQASTSALSLAPLSAFIQTMPLPAAIDSAFSQANVKGALKDLKGSAILTSKGLQSSSFSAKATDLSLQNFDWQGSKGLVNIPTFQGVSGSFKLNQTLEQTSTLISLDSSKGFVDLPRLFDSPRVNFDTLSGNIDIKLTAQKTDLSLSKLRFKNADLDGEIKGLYSIANDRSANDKTLGLAQMSGAFARADLAQLHRYMPLSLSSEGRDWLRHTISQGQASNLQFTLNGELSRFPFLPEIAQAGERFDLHALIDDAVLNFNPLVKAGSAQPLPSTSAKIKPWPLINDVSGELKLNGLSLTLLNMSGLIQALGSSPDAAPLPARVPKLSIASLTAPVVVFQTRVTAPAASMLALVRGTPLSQSFGDQLAVLKATGGVDVDATLSLDIAQPDKNLSQGTFKLTNGSLLISKDLPPLEQMNTTLSFKQSSLRVEQASAQWLGGNVTVSGGFDTQDPTQTLTVQGAAQLAVIKQFSPNTMAQALLSHAAGAVDYSLQLNAKAEGFNWQLQADLKDTALSWPGLLDKPAGVPLPFTLTRSPTLRSADAGLGTVITQDVWEATLGATVLGPFKATLQRQLDGETWNMTRGAIALGGQAELNPPYQGLGVHIATAKVNLDELRKEVEALPWAALPSIASEDTNKTKLQSDLPAPWMPSVFALQVGDLTVANRRFYDIVGVATRSGARGQIWDANLVAKGINGYINWTDNSKTEGLGGGQLIIKLTELTVPASEIKNATQEILKITPKQVPSVDLTIDRLTVGNLLLGSVAAKATNLAQVNERQGWNIERFSTTLPHALLTGSGSWKHQSSNPAGEVKLNLDLATDNLGLALEDLGSGKVVAGAEGKMSGEVTWTGTPFSLDIPSLSGTLKAEFGKGQFLKVDPGAGRLVGLFSLQNLPRRLTLDFKDMFGTGFAFDQMTATGVITKGVLKTEDFAMRSSAAQVSAQGEVALAQETQNLTFTVKPNFDAGSVSLLYMIINPPIGLATLATQFLLREPLRNSLTVEYAITGPWANPDVKQIKREIK